VRRTQDHACEVQENSKLTNAVHSEAGRVQLHPVLVPGGHDAGSLVRNVLQRLEDLKAEEILSIALAGKTSIADTMLIASGRSNVHVSAIADSVVKACKEAGIVSPRVEGLPHADWVVVDAGDLIVHVFKPDVRRFYNLEKMWGGDRPSEELSDTRRPS
jgi:ribosome-associated protein